jgi:hypothetical protein
MVLGEALDYARQGELAAARWKSPMKTAETASTAAPAAAKPIRKP